MHKHELRYCKSDNTIYCMDCSSKWTEEEQVEHSDIPWNYPYPKLGTNSESNSYTYFIIVGDN